MFSRIFQRFTGRSKTPSRKTVVPITLSESGKTFINMFMKECRKKNVDVNIISDDDIHRVVFMGYHLGYVKMNKKYKIQKAYVRTLSNPRLVIEYV